MLIAHLTDPHVHDDPGHAHNCQLSEAVTRINAMQSRPDLVIITGDLTNDGQSNEYEQLSFILSPLDIPCYVIPGNHDARDLMRATFLPETGNGYLPPDGDFLHYTIEQFPLRIIALDTLEPGKPFGRLCEQRLNWLSERLVEERKRPTIVIMHHPPFISGLTYMDTMRCMDGPALEAIIADAPNVERVLCGHLHRPAFVRFGGTIASIAPSTAFHLATDLNTDHKLSTARDDQPAFQLHLWTHETGLVTHTVSLPHLGKITYLVP